MSAKAIAATQSAAVLEVIAVTPQPNYGLYAHVSTAAQLTDREMANHPMWLNRATLGWAGATPIVMHARLVDKAHQRARHSGTLKVRTVARKKSEISIPHRIDVYGFRGGAKWVHLHGQQFARHLFADARIHWLEVAIVDAPATLLIVVHANGEYFFADEITWTESLDSRPLTKQREIHGESAAIGDSLHRLKLAFAKNVAPTDRQVSQWRLLFPGVSVVTWTEDSWGALSSAPDGTTIMRGQRESAGIHGYQNEVETICIGLLNVTDASITIRPTWNTKLPDPSALRLGLVAPVVAADGSVVYDAIIPKSMGAPIVLPGRFPTYLWLTADLSKIPPGTTEAVLELEGVAPTIWKYPIAIQVVPIRVPADIPAAVTWAYLSDQPIFANPKHAIQDMREHGVNVVVVPSAAIPEPSIDKVITIDDFSTLDAYMRHFAGESVFLLYLDWRPNRISTSRSHALNPAYAGDARRRDQLASWLATLKQAMTRRGLRASEWALYPFDEPAGRDIPYLASLLAELKALDSAVRIYANPVNTPTKPTSAKDISALRDFVDVWQPDARFAETAQRSLFQSRNKAFWVYANPRRPAKSELPSHYRLLSWRAWTLGATGVGFWSYSDTRASSAWDDFDSSRPDWAVVYEGVPLVSSRRWEAFREGLEDFRLLAYSSQHGAPIDVGRIKAPTMEDVTRTRRQMLKQLTTN